MTSPTITKSKISISILHSKNSAETKKTCRNIAPTKSAINNLNDLLSRFNVLLEMRRIQTPTKYGMRNRLGDTTKAEIIECGSVNLANNEEVKIKTPKK